VVALFHDILITLGVFSFMDREVSLTVVAAFLTIGGYSINDTIVVFDRIRENLGTSRRLSFQEIVNKSINQTLGRTVMTSATTLLAVISLFFLGGVVIHDFALAMIIGVLIGTYSSVFVASALALDLSNWWVRRRAGKPEHRSAKAVASR
jgi:preprotein translocase subunit SecF